MISQRGEGEGNSRSSDYFGEGHPCRAIPGSLQSLPQWLVIVVLQHTKGCRGNKGRQGHAEGQRRKPAEERALGFAILPRPSAHPAINPS